MKNWFFDVLITTCSSSCDASNRRKILDSKGCDGSRRLQLLFWSILRRIKCWILSFHFQSGYINDTRLTCCEEKSTKRREDKKASGKSLRWHLIQEENETKVCQAYELKPSYFAPHLPKHGIWGITGRTLESEQKKEIWSSHLLLRGHRDLKYCA